MTHLGIIAACSHKSLYYRNTQATLFANILVEQIQLISQTGQCAVFVNQIELCIGSPPDVGLYE